MLGILAELALNGPALGINVSILLVATLGAAVAVRRRGRVFDRVDAWLPITAVVLAGLVAVRGDDFLIALDTLGALAFGGATIIALSGTPVTRRSIQAIAALTAWVAVSTLAGSRTVLPVLRPPPGDRPRFRWPWLAPLARGLVVGLPLAAVFAVLFASADPIFRRGLADILALEIDLGEIPGRVVFALVAAWLAVGSLAAVILGAPRDSRTLGVPAAGTSAGGSAAPRAAPANAFGAFEATVVLLTVNAVVGGFVALQVAYLFGGLDTLAAAGLTYSDYARRGFFELVAAAMVSGTVVAVLDGVVKERSRVFLASGLALLALTGVVLASAAFRLSLYQQAYGWTELRFYVFTAIAYVGVALLLLGGLVAVRRTAWLVHGLVALGVVGLVGLNVAAPAAFVAERNLERALDPGLVPPDGRTGLDETYLAVLPDDAVGPMVAALDSLPAAERAAVERILEDRRRDLATNPSLVAPMAWNLGREQARAALSRRP